MCLSICTMKYLIQNLCNYNVFRLLKDIIRYRESLKYSLHRALCNLDIFITCIYIQALANWEPDEYGGPVSTEPYVTVTYAELEAYSEPSQISVTKNFIQNHL